VTADVTLEFSYDGELPTGEAWSGTGLATASVTQHYDSSLRRDSQQVAVSSTSQPAIAFSYDNDDLLTQAGALTLTRDPANGLLRGTSLTSGGGTVDDTLDYTSFGELQHYQARSNGTPLLDFVYGRDNLGRITSLTETLTLPPALPVVTTKYYTYDSAGRLFQVCGNATCTAIQAEYHYDANGNRITGTVTARGTVTDATYDAQDRLTAISVGPTVTSYEYTANGELRRKAEGAAVTTYAYDAFGNLRHVDLPDGTAIDYVVDGRNRRIGKIVDGNLVQQWLYQDQLEPLAELDGSGNLVAEFIYGSKSHVPAYILRGGQTYRIISDHLGSVRLVVNVTDGSVAQSIDYDEFGVVITDSSPGWQPFGFSGGIYNSDSGLVRLGVRDYDPSIGRWTARDPIGFAGRSANLYGYVAVDPVNRSDPGGKAFDLAETSNSFALNAVVATIKTVVTACITNLVSTALGLGSIFDFPVLNTACAVRSDSDCNEHFTKCLDTSMADLPGSVWGESRCGFCRQACVRNGGQWPDIVATSSGRVRCDYSNF
jgi:RHS repeat-associated protein